MSAGCCGARVVAMWRKDRREGTCFIGAGVGCGRVCSAIGLVDGELTNVDAIAQVVDEFDTD